MDGQDPIDLVIMLRIVEYISTRSAADGHDRCHSGQIISVVNNLADCASIGTLISNDAGNYQQMSAGDQYLIGQSGAVGPNAHASNTTLSQAWSQLDPSVDLLALADELNVLRKALKIEASEPAHDIAVGEVANAQIAAMEGDSGRVLDHLRKAGKWVLAIARDIGVAAAAAAITSALGL